MINEIVSESATAATLVGEYYDQNPDYRVLW